MEGILHLRVECDVVVSVNHLGEAKDVGYVIGIVVNFAKGWDLSFKVQRVGTSIGVHGDGWLGWENVSNKVSVEDSAVNAGARV